MDKVNLLKLAEEAYKHAYAPYSGFRVGAAVICADGSVFTGCNVENSAGTSVCAERVAIFKAISEGAKDFVGLAIACDIEKDDLVPCGFCLQTLSEFCDDIEIYTPTKTYTLNKLLPERFKLK